MVMTAEQQAKVWSQIVAKAWTDDKFHKRLKADPAAVLKEHGVEVAPGVQVKLVEDTPTLVHLTMPPRPGAELSDDELDRVAGGASMWGQPSDDQIRITARPGVSGALGSITPPALDIRPPDIRPGG